MKTGNKIATVIFWVAVICLAVAFAWQDLRLETARSNPTLLGAVVLLCVVAALGVRECIRVVKGRSTGANRSATAIFWIGVAGFFVLAGIMTWAVLSKG